VPTELTLALVPSGDSQKLVETAKPLTDYLTKALGVPVSGVVSTNYAGAVEAMGADKAQIGLFAPLPMIQACQKYGAKIVLQSVRFGSSTYHTQFMTNDPDKYCTISKPVAKASNKDYLNCNGTADAKTGPVALDALKNMTKGTKIGLLDPGSTSGYIFPTLALINEGFKDPKSDLDIVQLEAHDQSVLAVYSGDVEVGVSYDDARDAVVKDKPDVGQKVVVFAYSDEIPNDGVVVSGGLTSDWQNKITKTLEDYSNTAAGKKVLGDIYQIDALAPAVPSSLGKVAEAVAKLGLTG
jgi:phosphonate transport system substrate-binding protein